MSYNPYDLLVVKIDGVDSYARVLELDSEIKDVVKSTNRDGQFVVPKRIITMCAKCGQPLDLEISLPQPPFPAVVISCESCHPAPVETCTFIDPVASGRMTLADLSPTDLPVSTKPAVEAAEGFTLERFKRTVDKTSEIEETFEGAQEDTSLEIAASSSPDTVSEEQNSKKAPKKQKKTSDETDIG
jgi:hypothetical protein